MSDWLEFWNFSSADWAGLTFAVVLVALIVAWVEARGAAQLREAQARPFVTIDLHADKSFPHLLDDREYRGLDGARRDIRNHARA